MFHVEVCANAGSIARRTTAAMKPIRRAIFGITVQILCVSLFISKTQVSDVAWSGEDAK
jgi:hypothetical protein